MKRKSSLTTGGFGPHHPQKDTNMMEYVEHDTEDYFSDRTSSISGIATLRIEYEEDYSADIGGVDGHICVATLIDVQVGNTRFTANQIAEMFGSGVVAQFESRVAEWEEMQ